MGIPLVADDVVSTSTSADVVVGISTVADGVFVSFELIRCFAKPVAAKTDILLWIFFSCRHT